MEVVTLLDVSDTGRRLSQQGLALVGAALVVAGIVMMATAQGAALGLGLPSTVLGVGLIFAASRVLVRWELPYGGHIIRFENSVIFGERLVIDGKRYAAGVLGYRKVIEGEIGRGSHAGTRVRAESVAGVFRFRCKLSVESP